MRIYDTRTKKVLNRLQKAKVKTDDKNEVRLFHDDTLKTFCRRLTWTPDGELLIVPSGHLELGNNQNKNVTYIFTRRCLSK